MSPPRQHRSRRARPASLRIIGGQWRGRQVAVSLAPGLRPTPARVRETLFGWLAPIIAGARCIDLFAGTGALGLEALSRGAARVDFIEHQARAAGAIRAALQQLGAAERATVTTGDALQGGFLDQRVDIVFIDPPFAACAHAAALAAVTPALGPGARVYMEYPAAAQSDMQRILGDDFEILRVKRAGAVGYCLARAAHNRHIARHE